MPGAKETEQDKSLDRGSTPSRPDATTGSSSRTSTSSPSGSTGSSSRSSSSTSGKTGSSTGSGNSSADRNTSRSPSTTGMGESRSAPSRSTSQTTTGMGESRASPARSTATGFSSDARLSPINPMQQTGIGGRSTATGFHPQIGTPQRLDPNAGIGGGLYSLGGVGSTLRPLDGSMASLQPAVTFTRRMDNTAQLALDVIRSAEAGTKNPYNRLVSGGPQDYADLTNMTVREAVELASGLKAKGHLANVLGAYQFKDTTLSIIANKLGVMDEKFTPELQDKLARGLFQHRADLATVDGKIDVDRFAGELAKEWASLATSAGTSHYDPNGIDKASVPYGIVRNLASDLVEYGIVRPGGSARTAPAKQGGGGLPDTVSTLPTPRPPDRFAEKYLRQPSEGVNAEQTRRGVEGARDVAIRESGLPAANPGSEVVGDLAEREFYRKGGVPLNQPAAPTLPGPRMVPDVTQPPAVLPEPAMPPRSRSPGPAAPAVPEDRSFGQKVAGGGFDVLAGLVPVAGPILSIINGGLALTGNRTIGDRLVDRIGKFDGDWPANRVFGETGYGESSTDRNTTGSRETPTSTTVAKPAQKFEDTYLKPFTDDTWRPTPYQRWIENRDTYAG